MGARKANVKHAIEAVFMNAPIFVVTTWAPALRMSHAIDDTWRLQDWLPRSLTWERGRASMWCAYSTARDTGIINRVRLFTASAIQPNAINLWCGQRQAALAPFSLTAAMHALTTVEHCRQRCHRHHHKHRQLRHLLERSVRLRRILPQIGIFISATTQYSYSLPRRYSCSLVSSTVL
jgi:hypothetical protein